EITTEVGTADVGVVSGAVHDESIEAWRNSGRPLIVITTAGAPPVADEHVLVYPFRAMQLLQLLSQLDARLSRPALAPGSPSTDANQNAWRLIEALRTLREVQNSEVWLAGAHGRVTRIWIKGDGSEYVADEGTL